MKNLFISLIVSLLFCGSLAAAENCIGNPLFSQLSPAGLPLKWSFGGNCGKMVHPEKDATLFDVSGKSHFASVQRLKVPVGKRCCLSFRLQGTPGSKFKLYGSWIEQGKRHYGDAREWSCSGKMQDWSQLMDFAPDAKDFRLFFNIMPGSKIRLYSFSLAEAPAAPGVLLNGDFALRTPAGPANWVQRQSGEFYRYGTNCVTLTAPAKKITQLVQTTRFKPGDCYICRFEVQGTGRYRAYLGWIQTYTNKKREWKGTGAAPLAAPKTWGKREFRITIPAGDFSVSSNMVLQAEAESSISFRNLVIVPAPPPEKSLGGVWELQGKADFAKGVLSLEGGPRNPAKLLNVPVRAEQYYRLNFRVYGVGVARTGTGFHGFHVSVQAGKKLIEAPWDDAMGNVFQEKSFSFTAPSDSVTLRFASSWNSKLKIDNIRLTPCEYIAAADELLTVTEPFYRNSFYSSRPQEKFVRGTVKFPKGVKSAVVCFNGKEQKLSSPGSFSFDISGLKEGKYTLSVNFDRGKPVTTEIRKLPKAPVEVVLAPDLFFYVNGKRVMPNSYDYVPEGVLPNGYYKAARAGGNFVKYYFAGCEEDLLAGLDKLHKLGLKAVMVCACLKNTTQDEKQAFLHIKYNVFTPKVKAHPALFAYFMVDEPAWAGISLERLRETYHLMKEFDPYHPVWINEAPRGGLDTHRHVAGACDAYGVDIYPVPYPSQHSGLEDKMMTSVGKYAELCRKAGNNKKAVWLYLQGYSWKTMNNPDTLEGYPTPAELRFMGLDAWMHGATGAILWGSRHVRSPKFHQDMQDYTKSIHALSGMLTLPRTPYKVAAPLFAVEYRSARARYIAVENPTGKIAGTTLPAEFKRLNGPDVKAIPPWSVTIYGTTSLPEPDYKLPAPDKAMDTMPDPFLIYLKGMGRPYKGKAGWIWAKGLENSLKTVAAEKTFTVRKPLRSAKVIYTADDQGDFRINGKKLPGTRGWEMPIETPVKLKQGENRVQVTAINTAGGACGILFDLMLEYEDGTKENIVSGADWLAGPEKGPMKPALLIAPYGKGAWGTRCRIR